MAAEFWVTNMKANTVLVCNYDKVLKTIPVGGSPRCLAFSADGTLVFVANSQSHYVSVVDANQRKVIRQIGLDWFPTAVAFTPDGEYLCIAVDSTPNGRLLIYSTGNYKLIKMVKVGNKPSWVAASQNEKVPFVCVADFGSATVSIVDTATKTLAATVSVCDGPTTVAMTPRGTKAYAPSIKMGCLNMDGYCDVPVIDLQTKKWTNSVTVIWPAYHVAVGTKAAYLTLSAQGGSGVAQFDPRTDTNGDPFLTAGEVPYSTCVAFNEHASLLAVTNSAVPVVSLIDTNTRVVIGRVELNKNVDAPFGVAFRP